MSGSDFGGRFTRTVLCGLLSMSLSFGGVPVRAWAEALDAEPVVSNATQEEVGPIDSGVEEQGLDGSDIAGGESDDAPADNQEDGSADVDQSIGEGVVPEASDAGDQPNGQGEDIALDSEPLAAEAPESAPLELDVVASGEWGECSWSIDGDGLLLIWPTDGKSGRLRGSNGLRSSLDEAYFPWYRWRARVKAAQVKPGVSMSGSAEGMFKDHSFLTTADLSNLDTSSVTDMYGMFSGCSGLPSLDVSGWDTSAVKDMGSMFSGCYALRTLDVSGWDTSSLTNMGSMFYSCSSLASLDVSGWVTSSVTSMGSVFRDCSGLSSLDVSGWDTSSVTDTSSMFSGCSSLTSLDVSGWGTSAVTNMYYMFFGCSRLSALDVSGWKTSSVTDMGSMFYGCSSLTSLDVSGWGTSSVEYMYSMFEGCSRLSSLDVSGWKTSSVTDMHGMFSGCSRLSSLDVSGWKTSSVEYMYSMFSGCSSLVALDLSGWSTSSLESRTNPFSNCTSLARISVGSGWSNGYYFPEATNPDGKWRSVKDGKWYTPYEIDTSRKGIADTYTNAEPSADVTSSTVSKVADQTYSGSEVRPKLAVKVGSKTLREGTDYDVLYASNVDVGIATATVRGKGAYGGAKSVTFKILPADISKCAVDPIPEQAYTGTAIRPAIALRLGSATLRSGVDYTLSYKDNTEIGTATVTVTGERNLTGSRQVTFRIVEEPTNQGMYRLYNPNSGEHFYTASAQERDALVNRHGWSYEGVGWLAPIESKTPVFRLYNAYAGDHHYTTSAKERDALKAAGWKYEGIGWYSDDAKGVPLYRQYNPYAATGSHNYTTSKAENDALVSRGWKAEGIGWYGVKQ